MVPVINSEWGREIVRCLLERNILLDHKAASDRVGVDFGMASLPKFINQAQASKCPLGAVTESGCPGPGYLQQPAGFALTSIGCLIDQLVNQVARFLAFAWGQH